MQRLKPIIDRMSQISLQEMSVVKLMDRIDSKYLLSKAQLHEAFALLADSYSVQTIGGEAVAPYHTLYFDTPDVAMYTMHHNRKLHRQKLRVRQYRQNNTTFFELKDKNNRGKTEKTRIPVAVERFNDCLTLPEVGDFVANNTPYTVGGLLPQVENHFNRITLANNALTERVTIDSDITFANRHTGLENNSMADLVIVEVKQNPAQRSNSLLMRVFSKMRIQPKRVSKYCLGTVLTNPDAKYNRYKDKLRYIEKQLKVEN